MYITSNVTPEEYFRHYCRDEHARKFYENIVKELMIKQDGEDAKAWDRQEELLREQIFFAQELISELECQLNRTTRLTEFKKDFDRILADSLFER